MTPEIDVVLSGDAEVVVSHEGAWWRSPRSSRSIGEFYGRRGHRRQSRTTRTGRGFHVASETRLLSIRSYLRVTRTGTEEGK